LSAPRAATAAALSSDEPRYGWVVVWATFVALGVIFGVAYSFAAFFEPFVGEFHAQRADVSLVFGLCGLIYFAFGAFGGMLSDRLGPRLVTGAGMLCIAAGLVGASFARSMLEVTLTYGVGVGLGIALVYTPAIGTVQPWFTREIIVTDPDGYRLTFTAPQANVLEAKAPSFDEVIAKARGDR